MIHYILPVIGAFAMSTICGFIFIPVLLNFCKEKKLYDIPNQRKVHKCLIPRLGGIAFTPSMLLSFLIVTLIMSSEAQGQKLQVSTWTLGLLISLLLIYSVGIVDDLIGLDAKSNLLFRSLLQVFCQHVVYISTTFMDYSVSMRYLFI